MKTSLRNLLLCCLIYAAYALSGVAALAQVNGAVSYNYYPINATTRSLNGSLATGSTIVNLDVSASGGASYTVPIDLPPGVNGVQPNLSLVYSSQGGAGLAGYGWQLNGVSTITRTGQTIYHDGQRTAANLDLNDRFVVDGQRLTLINGSYGGANSQYYTESESYSRVTANGTIGNGPEKFTAETRQGLKLEYGFTSLSRQAIAGYTEPLSWYISSVSDLFGNRADYNYFTYSGVNYLSNIVYGSNKVVLYYRERTDVQYSYFKGVKSAQNLLLDKIEVYYNNTRIKWYQLSYSPIYWYADYFSVLNEIYEYGSDGSMFNSLVFSYQTPEIMATSYSEILSISNLPTNTNVYGGDFNGDGIDDLYTLNPSDGKSWKLYIRSGSTFTLASSGTYSNKVNNVLIRDCNGDGKDDLILIYDTGTYYYAYFLASNGISFGSQSQFLLTQYPYNNQTYFVIKRKEACDIDGDGKNDYLDINTANNSCKVYSYSSATNNLALTTTLSVSSWGVKQYLGDFNGDGKTDIWVLDSNGTKIYSYNNGSLATIYNSTWPTSDHYMRLGDFNGDGKCDFFVYDYKTSNWSQWQLRISTGTDFEGNYFNAGVSGLKGKESQLYPGDFNGDGRQDFVLFDKNSSGFPIQYYFITTDNAKSFYIVTKADAAYDNFSFIVGDYNGDGKSDFFTWNKSAWTNSYRLSTTTGVSDILMTASQNGLGVITQISYGKLSQVGVAGSAAAFPVSNYSGAVNVVTSLQHDNGAGGYNTLSYTYQGAKMHRQGKGFLCFEKSSVTDNARGASTERQFGYNTTWFTPELTKSTTSVGGSPVSMVTSSYGYKTYGTDPGTKRYFQYTSSSTEQDVLKGFTINLSYSYDDWGNLTNLSKTYNGAQNETTYNTYENITGSTQWLLGRLTHSRSACSGSSGMVSTEVSRSYSPTSNQIVSETWYPTTACEYVKSYSYWPAGIVKSESATADGSTRTTQYEYSTDNTRITKVTAPTGLSQTKLYNGVGLLQSETDYLGNTTAYTYDGFGRELSRSGADGSQMQKDIGWASGSGPANCIYYDRQIGNDGSLTIAWYDKLGRELRKDVKGFDGTMISTLKSYNTKGELVSESEPYYTTSSPTQTTGYTYDSYGRVTAINRFTGSNTTFGYSTNTVTETTDGRSYSKKFNADGTLQQAVDPGGTISYTYRSDGKPRYISRNGMEMASIQYDAAGNQTLLSDKSAGDITYTYTKFGELKSQSDAKGQTTTINYLNDGRIDNKVTPEGTISYSYNSNKQLTGVLSPGGIQMNQSYDNLGRLSSVSEIVDGATYTTTFTYDNIGRLSGRTHPGGIAEQLTYNAYGYLLQVSADGQAVWSVSTMDQRLHVRTGSYGTGSALAATFGYDSYGLPSSTVTGSVQHYSYSFDPVKGNLLSRKNEKNGMQEGFSYDSLDRLTWVSRGSSPFHNTVYDDNGNITSKSDAGTLSYENSNRPFQVTKLVSSNANYGANQTVVYNSFEKVSSIGEGSYGATFVYDSGGERVKMNVTQNGASILTRTYIGSRYIKEVQNGVTKEYTFIGGDSYSAPGVIMQQGGVKTRYYLLRDHLGSVTHVVDNSGSVLNEYSFDAWGRQRNVSTWIHYAADTEPALFMGRGYTGHEHLPWFNLVNMNGRLYDPVVGRFLSPDPYVQLPEFSQNFNRYSYCLNNPLKYNDPDGEWIHLLIGAIVGGVINTIAHRDQIDNFWDGLAAFGVGAGGGVLAAATGGAVLGAFGTTAAVSAGAGGFLGGSLSAGVGYLYGTAFMSLGNNAFFGDPMPTGKQFFTGLGLSMITAGVLQGSNALANGRSFWKGVLDEVPQQIKAPLLPTPKAELNSNALRAEMEPMPIATERLPQSQTFNRVASGDGKIQWVNAEAAKTGGQTVYRAVDATEAAIIKSTGKFSLQQGGVEVKYFAKTLEDAHQYGQWIYRDGYSIIQGTVKGPLNINKFWYPNVDIGAYVFPREVLPYIIPN